MGTINAIEFSGKIEHGAIKLPQIYKDYENCHVRIIILIDTSDDLIAKKEGLKAVFKSMEKTKMFARIENPSLWQKKIRDEWEQGASGYKYYHLYRIIHCATKDGSSMKPYPAVL